MFTLAEAVKVKISERDDIADLLGLIPTWIISAVVWYIFSKVVIDRLSDKKPGTEINAAIIASDVAGVTFPAGVALAAQIDVTMTLLGIKENFTAQAANFILDLLIKGGIVPDPGRPIFGEVRVNP